VFIFLVNNLDGKPMKKLRKKTLQIQKFARFSFLYFLYSIFFSTTNQT